jgi:NitT/TauT family transport system ATP-binding protein
MNIEPSKVMQRPTVNNKTPEEHVSPSNPFMEVSQVAHWYTDNTPVLADISMVVEERDFVALVGPSGVGKSTLLKILGGLLQPTAGSVQLNGQPLIETEHSVGVVFQQDNLMPWRTVYENIRLPLEIEQTAVTSNGRIDELLALVGLSNAGDLYPSQLSGGMAQRVALARALVHEPQLLLLDEPFGALDALTRERMGQELLRIWQAKPVTVLMVTHSIMEAVFLADQVVVMNGREGEAAALTEVIDIPIPRPRRLEDQFTAEFLDCVRAVRAAIGRSE